MKKWSIVVVLALIALIHWTTAFRRNPKLPIMLNGRPLGGFLNYHDEIRRINDPDFIDYDDCTLTPQLQQINFTQTIDHSNPSQGTYQQRYWYNPLYVNETANPEGQLVFLMVQGESIAGCKWISNPDYQYLQWAKTYGAHVFQLEHRFFGYSRPKNDLTYASLKLLTISQALDDIASFIDGITVQYNFTNPRWVTFGGSYPGVLNALFRQKYPNKTVGAIGSSAGLKYKLDMYEYAMNVEKALGRPESNCTATIDAAWKQMVQMALSTDGRSRLNTIFNIQPAFDENTTQLLIDNFFANLYAYYQDVTQYTYDGRDATTMGGKNISSLCAIMNDASVTDLVQRVRNVVNWVDAFGGATTPMPFSNDYYGMMSVLSNTSFDYNVDYADPDYRGWMWLCCNEIGLLQTTDQGRNIFQQTVPINYFFDMCTDMFDPELTAVEIQRRVDVTTNTYGGLENYQGSKIVLPSGELDPWHTLALNQNDTARQITTVLVAGGAHCSDMYPRWAGEADAQKAVRPLIESQLQVFIGRAQ